MAQLLVLGDPQEVPGEAPWQRPVSPKSIAVKQGLDVEGRLVGVIVVLGFKMGKGAEKRRPAEKARPEEERTGGIGRVGRIGRQDAERRAFRPGGRAGRRRPASHERPVPVDFMPADAHGRILEPIAEIPAGEQLFRGLPDFFARGPGAVEEQPQLRGQQLAIAGHGFAVEPEGVALRAEQDAADTVHDGVGFIGFLVSAQALPAM